MDIIDIAIGVTVGHVLGSLIVTGISLFLIKLGRALQ